jgi:hypothetical protein
MPGVNPEDREAVRAARSLYGRWHALGAQDRERLAPLAAAVKHHALELPGRTPGSGPADDLSQAGEELAEALGRLDHAEVTASRGARTRPDTARPPQSG